MAALGAAAMPVAQGTARAQGGATASVVPGSYLVTLVPGDAAAVTAVVLDHEKLGVRVDHVFTSALLGYSASMAPAVERAVAADPRVRTVTPDRRFHEAAQGIPAGVARVNATRSSTKAGDGTGNVDADIAVLDTGIDADHPDLNVAGGVDCVSPNVLGAPAGPGTGSAGWDDTRGHGTHIAGIAAARDNGFGVVGVAPGARVWGVRVLDANGDGTLGSLVCGIDWVTAHASVIDVANMSLSGYDPDQGCQDGGLHEAICRSVAAGVTYTVAAGNEAADATDYSPASYREVITVSALADYDGKPGGLAPAPTGCPGADDAFATFSNYGSPVDLIAPGVCIVSTWKDGGYGLLSGTSQAAAYVAGAAALYRSKRPSATPAQVRAALVAAGSANWKTATDPDGHPEPLLDVAGF